MHVRCSSCRSIAGSVNDGTLHTHVSGFKTLLS